MGNVMYYKGFYGSVEVDSGIYVGRILRIDDVITYSAATRDELDDAFHEAVEDYLDVQDL